jgi:hypothetical protein
VIVACTGCSVVFGDAPDPIPTTLTLEMENAGQEVLVDCGGVPVTSTANPMVGLTGEAAAALNFEQCPLLDVVQLLAGTASTLELVDTTLIANPSLDLSGVSTFTMTNSNVDGTIIPPPP